MSVNVFDKNDRTITPVAGSGVAYTVDHGVAVTGTDGIATIRSIRYLQRLLA